MELPGIGIKTAMKMISGGNKKEISEKLKEVEVREKKVKRHLLPYAAEIASRIMDWMLKDERVVRVDPLGSLRRKASTVGDIDLACVTDEPVEVLTYFTKYPDSQKTIEQGEHSASILIPGNVSNRYDGSTGRKLWFATTALYRIQAS